MSAPSVPAPDPPRSARRRRWKVGLGIALVVAASLLAAVFVPVHAESHQIEVSSASDANTSFSPPGGVWVTVHFVHPGPMRMMYGMEGPRGGMMFQHRGMAGGDSYSFWSNGGAFHCWAGYDGPGPGPTPVWVNATWGLL